MVRTELAIAAGGTVASGTVDPVGVFATDALNGFEPAESFGARVTGFDTGFSGFGALATVVAVGPSFFGIATTAIAITIAATTSATI